MMIESWKQRAWVATLLVAWVVVGSMTPLRATAANSLFVQAVAGSATGQTVATARMRATRAGSTLVVCVGSGEPITSISDNRSSVYTLVGSAVNSSGAGTLRVYHAVPAAGGVTSITVTHPWGASDIVAAEYAGVGDADRFQAQDSGFNAGAAWSSGATQVTRQANELLVGCGFEVYGVAVPSVKFTAGSGFTPRRSRRGVFLEDRTVSVAGAYAATGQRLPESNLNVVAALRTLRVGQPTVGGDSEPPSVPAALNAAAASTSQINLTWSASTDNVAVAGYRVFRGSQQIANVTGATALQDAGLNAATAYSYVVSAYDAAGNVSPASAPVQATTMSVAPPPPPPPPPPPDRKSVV